MWRSKSDMLFMAQEHNQDLVRQAEADRLNRHLNGTLAARIKAWWITWTHANAIRLELPKKTARRADRRVEYREQY